MSQTPPAKEYGLLLKRVVHTFGEKRDFIRECLRAGILRCLSPERDALCDEPATLIHWQDAAEWYPCCDLHDPGPPQWCGNTRFRPHLLTLNVIPEKAGEWLATLPPEERQKIAHQRYERKA